MAQQYIYLNMTGQAALTVLNNNFTELYGSITLPILIPGATSNVAVALLPNVWISQVFLRPISGTPTIRIGYEPNGDDIMTDTVINYPVPVLVQIFAQATTTIYITFVTGGELNIRIDYISNFD